MKSPGFAFFFVTALLVAGCIGEPTRDLGLPGKSLSYVPGSPSFDLEAIPDDTDGGVQISLSIPASSLTFLRTSQGYESQLDISVRAFVPRTDTLMQDFAWPDTIAVGSYEETNREESWLLTRSFKFRSGDIHLNVEILDRATGKRESRSQMLRVPSGNEIRPFLGTVVLQARTVAGAWATIVPLHIPSTLPQLRATAKVFGLRDGQEESAIIALLRFKLADAIPQPPSYYSDFGPTPGEPRAIWLDNPDTVRKDRQEVRGARDVKPLVAFDLRGLRPGLYRLVMGVTVSHPVNDGDTIVRQARVFSIKSPTFPRPTSLSELIDGMSYLLRPRERDRLRNTKSADEAHAVFDSLWMSFRPTKEEAAALLKRYYTRVEEANKLYTDLKEGWKTDRGMLYIMLGPPVDVLNSLDRQIWTFNIPGTSQQVQFVLRRMIIGEGELSIQTYVLYRDLSYDWVWEQVLSRWRTGGGGW